MGWGTGPGPGTEKPAIFVLIHYRNFSRTPCALRKFLLNKCTEGGVTVIFGLLEGSLPEPHPFADVCLASTTKVQFLVGERVFWELRAEASYCGIEGSVKKVIKVPLKAKKKLLLSSCLS